ncbi:MAG: hypothetical protein SAJ37_22945 [Oscillatoria sp. PMC 1068.18]|nr:hypothetical protein [Oscillatoria sp. PMC 1076.18]MEC4991603.1 hypothetical protein [Oscillatoria sp. PMC 1068.18]
MEPSPTKPSRMIIDKEFYRRLPLWLLFLLWLGYFFFGLLLTSYQARLSAWVLVWAGALIWTLDRSWTKFVPVIGAIAIIFSLSIPFQFLVLMVAIALASAFVLSWAMLLMGEDLKNALRDGCWLAGLFAIAMFLIAWFLLDNREFGGDVAVLLNTCPMPAALLLGFLASLFGSNAWMKMDTAGFTFKQEILTFATVTWLGFSCGWLVDVL